MTGSVSILIPCYNVERWIADALESALDQTWPDKEIIVVDDGSTDRSLDIAQGYAHRGVKVIAQKNNGASAARNRGLAEARGSYIQYLDADDLLAPDKIERQMQRLSKAPSDAVAAGAWGRFYGAAAEARFIREPVWTDLDPVTWLVTSWSGGGMMHPGAWLCPRAVIERAGRWDTGLTLNDDGEYFTRVVLQSSAVVFCEEARSYYRSGIAGSLSGRRGSGALTSYHRSLEQCTLHLLSVEESPRTRKACATALQRFVYAAYPDTPALVRRAELRIRELGYSDLKAEGGVVFRALSHVVGWKLARRMQLLARPR